MLCVTLAHIPHKSIEGLIYYINIYYIILCVAW